MNKAKELLKDGITLSLCDGNITYTSNKRGVSALLGLIDENVNVKGYDSADRVVGKGAAFLYIILGVARVHACVISRCALNTLGRSGIEVTYDILVDRIENRDKTGFCPIEEAVLSIDTPSLALIAIKNRLKELKS